MATASGVCNYHNFINRPGAASSGKGTDAKGRDREREREPDRCDSGGAAPILVGTKKRLPLHTGSRLSSWAGRRWARRGARIR